MSETSKHAYLVTGAGSGIGRAIAAKIVSEGHVVFGLGRSLRKLQETAHELGTQKFHFASVDLTKTDDSLKVVHEFRKWLSGHGKTLQGLVNNAGVFERLSFQNSSDVVWERQFHSNLLSAVRITRELHSELKTAAPSSVLNISSTLGLRPIADTSAYSAIKAAIVNWTQSLALEWSKDQVRVNCICPGIVDTPIQSFHSETPEGESRKLAQTFQPLARVGEPQEIAEAAWFLLSQKSSWTTGTVMTVDGGIHL